MLRIDSIKLPPEAGMAELAAEAARLLRMREKDILSLRLLRRSVDAREEVRLVYTVEVAVKEESAILRRARSRKISRAAQAQAAGGPKIRDERNVCDPGILVSERTHPGDGLRKPRALIRPFDGDPRDVRALTEPKPEELRVFRPPHPQ